MRPYTPVSSEDTKGYFDLIIKRYEQGRMSRHIHGLEPGDTLLVKGPFSKLKISSNMKKHLYMLAGGTGITPMYQVLLSLLSDPQDETKIDLLYSNSTPEDLILHEDLLALEAAHPRLKVSFFARFSPFSQLFVLENTLDIHIHIFRSHFCAIILFFPFYSRGIPSSTMECTIFSVLAHVDSWNCPSTTFVCVDPVCPR